MNQASLLPMGYKSAPSSTEPGATSFRNEKPQAAPSVRRQAWPFLASYEQVPVVRTVQKRQDLQSFVS